jgi:hypothetical protein
MCQRYQGTLTQNGEESSCSFYFAHLALQQKGFMEQTKADNISIPPLPPRQGMISKHRRARQLQTYKPELLRVAPIAVSRGA